LHVVAHAGETVGPESIRQAVETVGAERIGHGLTAARDAGVLALLRERRIPLEVCPTSNVATGLLLNLGEHPLPRFLDAGLEVTLNSDDPAMFGTSLEREFVAAAEQFALSRERILGLCASGFRAAFLPEEEKRTYLKTLAEAAAGI
jgi:aminodeoxyfutalosine deaminase